MSKLPRIRFFIILAALGFTLFYFRAFHMLGNSRAGHSLKNILATTMTPLEENVIVLLHLPAALRNGITDKQVLLHENKKLKSLLEKERLEKDLWREKAKTLLKLKEFETGLLSRGHEFSGVFASIIARNSNLWLTSLRISQGRLENVQTGNAVLSGNGLAGRIAETFNHASTLMLLVHPTSYIGVRVERTREAYILAGTGSGCALQFVPRDADIRTGDKLITSGLSDTIPPGIPVGKIQSIARQAERSELDIRVLPYVKFTSLEHVFVLQNYP